MVKQEGLRYLRAGSVPVFPSLRGIVVFRKRTKRSQRQHAPIFGIDIKVPLLKNLEQQVFVV